MYDERTTTMPATHQAEVHASAANPYGAPEPKRRNTAAFVGLGAVIALIMLAGGVALFGPFRSVSVTEASASSNLPSSRSAQSSTTFSEIPSSIEVPVADEAPIDPVSVPSGGPSSNPGGSPSPSGNGGGAPTPPPAPSAPSSPAPVITSFTTPESIDCHNGDFQTFTASWSTTHAEKVSISIDGPGVYKFYGPSGSDSLPFNCSTPHTFLLTAYNHDGHTVTKSITLHPRNVQTPDTGAEDPDAFDTGSEAPGSPSSDDHDSDNQSSDDHDGDSSSNSHGSGDHAPSTSHEDS